MGDVIAEYEAGPAPGFTLIVTFVVKRAQESLRELVWRRRSGDLLV